MMRLNGKVYLSYAEVNSEITTQLRRFSTSQHATPPKGISYVDVEFVTKLREKTNDIEVALGFLYKTENYIEFNEIVNTISSFFFDNNSCDSSLNFITLQLTESQRNLYREKYFHYLFNVFSGEIIKTLIHTYM